MSLTGFFALSRKIVRKLILYGISNKNVIVLFYNDPERSKVLDLIRKIKSENNMLLKDNEAYQIFMIVKNTQKINGDIAEVGCYKGGSAKLICEAKENKIFYIFDTFEGLPTLSYHDDFKQFHKGEFSASFEDVKKYLSKYQNVYIHKGLFPSITGNFIENKKFSFVHLDLDLYGSTLASIKFFYSKMNEGGIIMFHDYTYSPGVKKAVDDFFKDKLEPIIEMSGSQCLIVKLREINKNNDRKN